MFKNFLEGASSRLLTRRLSRWTAKAAGSDLSVLRKQHSQAGQLKAHLDTFLRTADTRLGQTDVAVSDFPKPHNADWAWRPALWRDPLSKPGISSAQTQSKLGEDITLFHDCPQSELTLRQARNTQNKSAAPFGLNLDVFQFDGSFLSLVIDIPPGGYDGLRQMHIIQMDTTIEMETPLEIFARLNIKSGPNTEQVLRELHSEDDKYCVEFDLAYASFKEKRADRAWVDLIFEKPQMNQVILRDLTFSRRPRAQL